MLEPRENRPSTPRVRPERGARMSARAVRILVADDQPDVREALRLLLKSEGFEVHGVASPAEVLKALATAEHDVALVDLNYARDTTSGQEGYQLLERVRELDPTLPLVVMTAWGSIEGAVDAVRRGARDYVPKPWDGARLVTLLRKEAEFGAMLRRSRRLETGASRDRALKLPTLIAEAPSVRRLLTVIERIAPSDANVLITGEHGTGKEVVARWIHQASARAGRAFTAVDAGGLSQALFESELFGHVRGAFTDAKTDHVGCFELADGGTLFLDEIGNLALPQQAKLLRVLQTGEFHPVGSSRTRATDARVLAATNIDVRREVACGNFREDLLYRLNTVEIHLPPLRERREDIAPLAEHFLARVTRRYPNGAGAFTAGALAALGRHLWPGNVRELEHVVERAVLMARGDEIGETDLGLGLSAGGSSPPPSGSTLDEVELQAIKSALARYGGSVTDAATALGLSRSALYRRLQHHGLKGGGAG
jgi:DNA-binding NtrC family response regulator